MVIQGSGSGGTMVIQNGSGSSSGTGDIEGVTAGSGLVGGGTSGTVTLALDPGTTYFLSVSSAAITYLPATVIDALYLTKSSASVTYLLQTVAGDLYLTKSSATASYLLSSVAANVYLTQSSATASYLLSAVAANVYLTQSSATATYLNMASTASLVQIRETLQPSSTFYISSGTVQTYLTVRGTTTLSNNQPVCFNSTPADGTPLEYNSTRGCWDQGTDGGGASDPLVVASATIGLSLIVPRSSTHTVSIMGQVAIDTDAYNSTMGTIIAYDGTSTLYAAVSTNTPLTTGEGSIIYSTTTQRARWVVREEWAYFALGSTGTLNNVAFPIWISPRDAPITIREIYGAVIGSTVAACAAYANFQERPRATLTTVGTNIFAGNALFVSTGTTINSFSKSIIAPSSHIVIKFPASAEPLCTVDSITGIIRYTRN